MPNARDVLCSLYAKTLSLVQSFPRDSGYRRQSETVVQQRLAIVQADSSPESIEKKIGCGQMEELIDQVCVCVRGGELLCFISVVCTLIQIDS